MVLPTFVAGALQASVSPCNEADCDRHRLIMILLHALGAALLAPKRKPLPAAAAHREELSTQACMAILVFVDGGKCCGCRNGGGCVTRGPPAARGTVDRTAALRALLLDADDTCLSWCLAMGGSGR